MRADCNQEKLRYTLHRISISTKIKLEIHISYRLFITIMKNCTLQQVDSAVLFFFCTGLHIIVRNTKDPI